MKSKPRKILLGVTASESLKLMNGLPEFLASKGWEVVVVASWEDQKIPDSTSTVRYLDLRMSRNPSPLLDLASLIRWLIVIFKESPQVVFCGTPKAGMLGIFASWFNRTPVRIYHLRGLRLETSYGVGRIIFSVIERIVISLSTFTLCVSQSLKDAVVSRRLGSKYKLFVLGKGSSNGIDINEFGKPKASPEETLDFSKKYGLNPKLPIIGFVGRLTKDKGVFDLIYAHEILIANGIPNQLLLVGKTENQIEEVKINELIYKNPLIFHTGLLQNPQIAFNAMTIFCLPTYREGFPNVVLEAGLSKVPTVTTDATGAVDSVLNEVTGLIYQKGNIQELVYCIERLIKEPKNSRQFGQNAFKFVTENFERVNFWEKLNDLLLQALNESKVSS